jgi:hypothetical protein
MFMLDLARALFRRFRFLFSHDIRPAISVILNPDRNRTGVSVVLVHPVWDRKKLPGHRSA